MMNPEIIAEVEHLPAAHRELLSNARRIIAITRQGTYLVSLRHLGGGCFEPLDVPDTKPLYVIRAANQREDDGRVVVYRTGRGKALRAKAVPKPDVGREYRVPGDVMEVEYRRQCGSLRIRNLKIVVFGDRVCTQAKELFSGTRNEINRHYPQRVRRGCRAALDFADRGPRPAFIH